MSVKGIRMKKKNISVIFLVFSIMCMLNPSARAGDIYHSNARHRFVVHAYQPSNNNNGNRFAVPISAHYSFANRSFDDNNSKNSLSNLIFNKGFTIQDIFLFSKLSAQGKLSEAMAVGSLGLARGNAPFAARMANQPDGPFGAYADDFYTTLLAPVNVTIDAEHRELAVDASFIYQFNISDWENVNGAVGFTVPIESRLHLMKLRLIGGKIHSGALSNLGRVDIQRLQFDTQQFREFFSEFSSLNNFFERGILEPKGLTFDCRQRKTGFGDITAFGLLDFAGYSDYLDGMQVGVDLVFPSGGKPNPDTVWDLVLGNGGFFQADVFAHALFRTESKFLNPTLCLVGEFSASRSIRRRVPKQKKKCPSCTSTTCAN